MQKLFFLIVLLMGLELRGDVKPIDFKKLVSDSDLIVTAEVQSIRASAGGERYGSAKVVRVWKGEERSEVEFSISPLVEGDSSAANVGESVLLFLKKTSQSYRIAHFGYGRLPITFWAGDFYVTFDSTILFPKEWSKRGAQPRTKSGGRMELDSIWHLVKDQVEEARQQKR